MRKAIVALALVLLAGPAWAQDSTDVEADTLNDPVVADAISTIAVATNLGMATVSAFKADDRKGAFLDLGCRVGYALGLSETLKRTIHKERPDGSDMKSFPSMHTALATAGVTISLDGSGWKDWKEWNPFVAVGSGATAGSLRITARKHDLVDVTVGAAVGLSAKFVCDALH